MVEEVNEQFEEALDQLSEKVASSLASTLIRWFVRTILGLGLFGVLWYYVDWGVWLFLGYAVLAILSLILSIRLHFQLVDTIGRRILEEGVAQSREGEQ